MQPRTAVYLPDLQIRASSDQPLSVAERGALSILVYMKLTQPTEFTLSSIATLLGVTERSVSRAIEAMRIQLKSSPPTDEPHCPVDAVADANEQQRRRGRPCKISDETLGHVLFTVEADREISVQALVDLVADKEGAPVHSETVRRHLSRYYDRVRAVPRTILPPEKQTARLLFASRFLMQAQRHRVLFTDESYIKKKHGLRWRWVHKDKVEGGDRGRFAPVLCGKESLCLWGGIRLDCGATELCILYSDAEGNHIIDARRYISILTQFLVPFLNDHPDTVFQQDNARPHVAEVNRPEHGVAQFLYDFNARRVRDGVPPIAQLIGWPPYSPDLSPIEYSWATLKQLVSHHIPSDATLPDVVRALPSLWHIATSAVCRRAYALKQDQNLESVILRNGNNDY